MINVKHKGDQGERDLAEFLRDHGVEARRGQQHSGSPDSPDVISVLESFLIEGKRTENFKGYQWMEKAILDADGKLMPVIFWRKNRKYWLAICTGSTMIELMKKYNPVHNSTTEDCIGRSGPYMNEID